MSACTFIPAVNMAAHKYNFIRIFTSFDFRNYIIRKNIQECLAVKLQINLQRWIFQ